LNDFDPKVREAAAAAIAALTKEVVAPSSNFKRRYPAQPSEGTLAALPGHATIKMQDSGTIEIELLTAQAPISVAKFAELVRAGYYNNLTFHRVVPNFVIQGGSPGANEYSGAARYWREEPGTAFNLRGTIGLS